MLQNCLPEQPCQSRQVFTCAGVSDEIPTVGIAESWGMGAFKCSKCCQASLSKVFANSPCWLSPGQSECQQSCVPSAGSREEPVPVTFPASRVHPHSLASGLFLYRQSQPPRMFKSLPHFDSPMSLSEGLWTSPIY